MTYVSFGFYVLLAIILLIYYLLPVKIRWYALLIGSVAFYVIATRLDYKALTVLAYTVIASYIFSLQLEKKNDFKRRKNGKGSNSQSKGLLVAAIIFTVAPLVVFKEWFLFRNLEALQDIEPVVPLGLSFYTLQSIAYLVDVYRKKVHAQRDFLKYALFISFFPQIIQGPIPRYEQLEDQLVTGHLFDEKKFVKGYMLILWGFFLKLMIADKAGVVVDTVFNNYPAYRGMYLLVAGVLYSIQLYADFLACVTLAQGISQLFGIELVDNFNHPYFSTSIKDFWRRWHISLSSWLRDYIYIPLGGNRGGTFRKYLNYIITFAVSGAWHGSGFKYIFWGLLHAFYQIIEDVFGKLKNRRADNEANETSLSIGGRIVKIIITFFFVMLAWIIFRADTLGIGLSMIKSIFTEFNPWVLTDNSLLGLGLNWQECFVLTLFIILLIMVSIAQEKEISIRDAVLAQNIVIRWIVYTAAIITVMVFGTYGFGFDAQSFIYGGF